MSDIMMNEDEKSNMQKMHIANSKEVLGDE